jgi:hypothetical protein
MSHLFTVSEKEAKNVVTSIMFLDIIQLFSKNRPVHFSKHNISETGICSHPQVKPTQLDPRDRASPYLRTPILYLLDPIGQIQRAILEFHRE